MDKPLGALRGITMGIALLAAALYAVWALPLEERVISLADYLRTIQQSEGLDRDRVLLSRSMEATHDIVDRLCEGRLTLPEAAAAMREEFESRPVSLRPPIYIHERHLPEEERYMLQILIRVENSLSDDPRYDEVLKRLHGELQSYRAARSRSASTDSPKCPAVVAAH